MNKNPKSEIRNPKERSGSSQFLAVRDAVKRLVDDHGCEMMKIATEDEALTHDEVRERNDVFAPIIAIELKIGGPGARGDLELARQIGIDHVIAPMIESAYGLADYLAGAAEIFGSTAKRIKLGINIETVTAANGIDSILDADGKRILAQVTVGRGDLSKSMGASPDHESVMKLSKNVIEKALGAGYATSVGGGLDAGNVDSVIELLRPQFVNTRNFAFRSDRPADKMRAAIKEALTVEILLCEASGTPRALARISALESRISRISRKKVSA